MSGFSSDRCDLPALMTPDWVQKNVDRIWDAHDEDEARTIYNNLLELVVTAIACERIRDVELCCFHALQAEGFIRAKFPTTSQEGE